MSELDGINFDDLDKSFGVFKAGDATPNKSASDRAKIADELKGIDFGDLDKSFGVKNGDRPRVIIDTSKFDGSSNAAKPYAIVDPGLVKGAWQGLKDIPTSVAQGIGYLDDKLDKGLGLVGLTTGGSKRNEDFNARVAAENAALPVDNTAFDVGRAGGQILATAPLMPVKAFQAVSGAAKAVPYVGKLAGLVANGGLAGGIYGAATNSTNDNGLASNVGTNAAYGAAAGPIAEAGSQLLGKAVGFGQNVVRNFRANNALKGLGIDPTVANHSLALLTEAGYTPQQAKTALQAMGPQATLGDLDPALTTEVGGLARSGGKPTSIIQSRYLDRNASANSTARDLMETRLGQKPDYEIEKEAAKLDRQNQTSSDYNKAKSSNMALDVMPIAKNIHNKMANAVGSEAKELHEAGSYLFDKNGNIKTDTAPLLKVRQALDDRLSKLKSEGTSAATSTYRAVSEVRDQLDKVLKTNPDLAIADARYAKLRKDFEGIDIGRDAFKNNFENFEREWKSASPEKQDYMRKGLRIQIGDQMEKATRGELSEAQRLFGKSTNNRKIIKMAFGSDGEKVLDELAKEAKLRFTEHAADAGSRTANNLAVQRRPEYGGSPHEGHFINNVARGAALDILGGHGVGTVGGVAKGTIEGIKEKLAKEQIQRNLSGTADLLSRQAQHGRDTALDFLDRVHNVRGRDNFKLPVDNSRRIGPATVAFIPTTKRAKNTLSDLVGIIPKSSK